MVTAVSALVLAMLSTTLKERHDRNEALFNKRAILRAIEGPLGVRVAQLTDDQVQEIFDSSVEQYVVNMQGEVVDDATVLARGYRSAAAEDVDMAKERRRPEQDRLLPLFVFDDDGEQYYIVSVRGNGLWNEIWGNVALKSDLTTIAGVAFDHAAETPGLGAEITDNPAFPAQFIGKKIYDDKGEYTSVYVRKGGARDPLHEVDGISGATITANGVGEMLYRGIRYYEPYFKSLQNQ